MKHLRCVFTCLLLFVLSSTVLAQTAATGSGGAAASVDELVTAVAIEVLEQGGNAVDATVAAAAAVGVVEPFSGGIGGGGFMLIYLAESGEVVSIDGRETAPMAATPDMFLEDGQVRPFGGRALGIAVGVPGALAQWQLALDTYGTMDLGTLLQPAIRLAEEGFAVDALFANHVEINVPLFGVFPSTAQLYLVDGGPPAVGSLHRNPDLAATYRLIAEQGIEAFYAGPIGEDLVAAVQQPVTVADLEFPMVGQNMTMDDLAAYRALVRPATRMTYRGHDVYGMGPPSSGGLTVGLALGILQHFELAGLPEDELLHLYLEATRVAFADRGALMADADFVDVPVTGLQAPGFAAQRAELVGSRRSNAVAPGDPFAFQAEGEAPPMAPASSTSEGENTTHMTVADQWGNVVAYTITIEAPGGNGMVVPGRGFLLNNKLTDFDPFPGTVNSVQPGMRPRSSMSPTLVLKDGRPLMALGSPGGPTIISSVLQTLVNVLDLGMSAEEAVEAPRASYLGIPEVLFERSFARSVVSQLADLGHQMVPVPELGFVTMIVFNEDGSMTAVAEAQRGGGGSARVVRED